MLFNSPPPSPPPPPPLDGLEEVPLDGTGVNGGGNATGKYAGFFYCDKHLGTPVQTANATLVAAAPTKWSVFHRLRGHAYLYLQFKYDADLYPNGVPTVRVLTKGAKLLDPRVGITIKTCAITSGSSTVTCDTTGLSVGMLVVGEGVLPGSRISTIDGSFTFFNLNTSVYLTNGTIDLAIGTDAWSANSALCVADYMADYRFGKGIPWYRINRTDLSAEANICEESVVLDSGSEQRYNTNGIVTADSDALPDLVAAMAGKVIDTGGTWTIQAGAFRASSLDFTDGDLVGPISVQPRQSMRESYSGVRGTYIAAINNWQPADFPSIKNNTYAAEDGYRRRWKDVAYPFTTSAATAQRLAKIDLERGRQQIVVQSTYRLKAVKIQCGDTVRITRAVLGWTNKEFEVLKWAFRIVDKGKGNVILAVALVLRETASAIYDWADGEETTVDLAPNTTLPDPWTVAAPTSVTLTVNVPYVNADGTVIPRIRVQWPTPNNIYVESGGKVEIEYKEDGTGTWIPWSLQRGDTLEDYIVGVKVGLLYNVRVRFINELNVTSDWTEQTSGAVGGDTTTPNSGSSLTATAYPGYILLEWEPSTTNQVNEYLIYRSVNAAAFVLFASVALTQYNDADITPGDNYSYKVRAVTASEVQSADLGPTGAVVALSPPVGATTPSDPTASTNLGTSGTYDASDGSVFAYATIRVPALPANALWQNLLYRRNGATEWLIASGNLKNVVNADIRLDDLSPGVTYDVATQAWSPAGASAIVAMTGTSFTAATKTATAGAFSSVSLVSPGSYGISSKFIGAGVAFGVISKFTCPADKDLVAVEFKVVSTNDETSNSYSWFMDGTSDFLVKVAAAPGEQMAILFLNSSNAAGFGFVRSINSSGVYSTSSSAVTATGWQALGSMTSASALTGGDMAKQNASGVTITGGTTTGITDLASTSEKLGNGSSVRASKTRWVSTESVSVTGGVGVKSEDFAIDITNRGFSAKPDVGLIQVSGASVAADLRDVLALYVYDHGSNTASTAYVTVFRKDGGDLTAGDLRLSIEFLEY